MIRVGSTVYLPPRQLITKNEKRSQFPKPDTCPPGQPKLDPGYATLKHQAPEERDMEDSTRPVRTTGENADRQRYPRAD